MPDFKTLNSEIKFLCFEKLDYPKNWRYAKFCPVCGKMNIVFFFQKFGMSYNKCKKCNFVFLNPYPAQEMIFDLYNSQYYNSVREYIEIPRALMSKLSSSISVEINDYSSIYDVVSDIINRGKWLDVGGGIGSFLNLVSQKTDNFELYIIETNERSAEFAQKHFGVKVIKSDICALENEGMKFDVLSLLSVIEHISEPLEFLEKCVKIINPGGLLVVNTPRYSSLNRLISKESSYNVIPPYHVSLFNEKNLVKYLINRTELKLNRIWCSGHNAFSLIDLLHLSEYCDVKIPEKGDENIVVLSELTLKPMKRYVYGILRRFDGILEKAIELFDGRNMLNAVFKKS